METTSQNGDALNVERGVERSDVDDDGRPKRTGTLMTVSAHIITAVIGSGVLSLSWAIAQLGWIIGPLTLVIFSCITYLTSLFLADCYRNSDTPTGKRNYTYMSAVKSNLGTWQIWLCGTFQYLILCGTAVGYTITSGISAAAVKKSHCFHYNGRDADCRVSYSGYMVAFGISQIIISQLPDFHELWWLSVVAAVMSFSYSIIGAGLGMVNTFLGTNDDVITSLTGTAIGVDVTKADKVWNIFRALGNIAFSYSYAIVLIEIQDTIKATPKETRVMKKASLIGIVTTTIFYMLCGCFGYSAFGNKAPGNMLTGFGFYEPFWLIDIANICIVIHLLGAYQVFCQPVFAMVESLASKKWPNMKMLTTEKTIIKTKNFHMKINLFRLVWRTAFVVVSTILATLMPFFNDILSLLGAFGFWPLVVFIPCEMYMAKKKIPRFSCKGMMLNTLSLICLPVSLVAAIGSIQGVVSTLPTYKPFETMS